MAKKSKTPVLLAYTALIVLIAVAAAIVLPGSGGGEGRESSIRGKTDTEGNAHIALMNGRSIEIDGPVAGAAITANKKTIAVLEKDGTLYHTDKKQSAKNIIAENVSGYICLRDSGLIYTDDKGISYRYSFADMLSTKIGELQSIIAAKNSLSVLYATEDGGIFVMAADSVEGRRVGEFEDEVALSLISDDAQIAVWALEDGKKHTPVVWEGEERSKLDTVTNKYAFTRAELSDDGNFLVILTNSGETLYMKERGKKLVSAKLGGELADAAAYTEKGHIKDSLARDISGIYAQVAAEKGSKLYWVDLDGERETLLSGVEDFYIAGGRLVYRDLEQNLYYAELEEEKLSEPRKISGDAEYFELSPNGEFVYYMRDCSEEAGSLYCYRIGEQEPRKIASDAYCYTGKFDSGYVVGYFQYSRDGRSVYYWTEVGNIADTYSSCGNLMAYDYARDESEKIAAGVYR